MILGVYLHRIPSFRQEPAGKWTAQIDANRRSTSLLVSLTHRVETEFEQDQQTYHGLLRIGTGLAIVAGVAELGALAPRITCP